MPARLLVLSYGAIRSLIGAHRPPLIAVAILFATGLTSVAFAAEWRRLKRLPWLRIGKLRGPFAVRGRHQQRIRRRPLCLRQSRDRCGDAILLRWPDTCTAARRGRPPHHQLSSGERAQSSTCGRAAHENLSSPGEAACCPREETGTASAISGQQCQSSQYLRCPSLDCHASPAGC